MHSHPLTHQSDSLYNIVNGQVGAETEVNVQGAVDIGQDMRTIVSHRFYLEASTTR